MPSSPLKGRSWMMFDLDDPPEVVFDRFLERWGEEPAHIYFPPDQMPQCGDVGFKMIMAETEWAKGHSYAGPINARAAGMPV